MINYDTIKSVYEDKLTLMQWLVKVQKALKDATAVSFNVNKRGDATITFSILFDDGTELETDPIILEQGESVESATLRNGHLILTLTNGDELDAGDMGAVSSFSIDANQHLIVTYQDGSTDDLGAIFNGNVTIGGNLTAAIIQANAGLKSNYIEPINNPVVSISDISISTISSPNSNPIVVYPNIRCFDNIVDSNGHLRFMEGNGILVDNRGGNVEISFSKWSLSGTHLMFVVAAKVKNGATIGGDYVRVDFDIPNWILNKIVPVSAGTTRIEIKNVKTFGYDGAESTSIEFGLRKNTDNISVHSNSALTLTADTYLRVAFDLLIEE